MYHSRLKLNVQTPLKLRDITYRFVVYNTSANKQTKFEGKFDEVGFTEWYEIYNINTVLIYEIYIRGELLQKISAKAYPTKDKWSAYTLKTTSEVTKKVNENIKEIYLSDGVVGWYLVKQKETMLDWSKRVFKKPLIASDWDILRVNNTHISDIAPIKILTPGQVIILCNNTTSKDLNDYRVKAKKIESKLNSLRQDPSFDPSYFANTYDQLQEIKKKSDLVGLIKEPIIPDFYEVFSSNLKKDPFIFAAKEGIDSAINLIGHANKEAADSFTALLKHMDHEKTIKSKVSTRRNFAAFERKYAEDIKRMNRAAGQKFFAWNHGINYKNNRDAIRRTVFVRAKSYNSIDEYIKNMDETSKVSKGLKYGGRIIFVLDVLSSGQSVADVYKTGDSDATRKEIIKQTAKIEGGLAAGALGAYIGGMIVTAVVGTAGLPVLVIAGVAAVSITLGSGYVGGVAGASIAEYSYDKIKSVL
ncbi:hypothetical protein [uncultured Acinetobacter sp.]|uniref:hypothetical protein n=1 Tax=uncultured Acinetobacter sp. TaxID=165433 RepID=UPI00258476FE|nr:hypothetical protein [uncultured Acinetobacter sp.]